MQAKYGIIGGSGLYQIEGAKPLGDVDVPTPFGMPSDYISIMEIEGENVAFLPRHGKGHRLLPTEVPSLANIWALKSLGVEHILAISAVGSLVEEYAPGDFVVCDQIIDRTRSRANSYFGSGIAGHLGFADPFCIQSNRKIIEALEGTGITFHTSGTIIAMEGPLFSTRAESHTYRSWNAQLVGMTALPEVKLAREGEICFSLVAMVTDYDCWREEEEAVSVEMVLETMKNNTDNIKNAIPSIIKSLKGKEPCSCGSAAQYAVMTARDRFPYETMRKLDLFYGKYWK